MRYRWSELVPSPPPTSTASLHCFYPLLSELPLDRKIHINTQLGGVRTYLNLRRCSR